jgi:iron complex outermembrane receptor protein
VQTVVLGTGSVGGGATSTGTIVTARNRYADWLPSANLAYNLGRNTVLRLGTAKVMSRPQLQNLTPGTTAFTTALSNTATSAPSVTIGNPYLNPFRATTYDISLDHYFGGSGLISVAFFMKNLTSFPQQLVGEAPLSSTLDAATYQQVLASITDANLLAYTSADGVWAIRQYKDAPGGKIKGVEINFQHDLGFLGKRMRDFGVIANYTHIDSNLNYLTSSTSSTLKGSATSTAANAYSVAPFLNTSPDAFNATLYYENKKVSLRFSGSYRARYVSTFPIATGTCSVGTTTNAGAACNSPVMADFGYTENLFNLDFASGYQVNDVLRLTLDIRNLTNGTTHQTIYAANPLTSLYQSTGRVVALGARAVF